MIGPGGVGLGGHRDGLPGAIASTRVCIRDNEQIIRMAAASTMRTLYSAQPPTAALQHSPRSRWVGTRKVLCAEVSHLFAIECAREYARNEICGYSTTLGVVAVADQH
jgi:hypothetical protein